MKFKHTSQAQSPVSMGSLIRIGIITADESDFDALLPAMRLLESVGIQFELIAIDPYRSRGAVIEYASRAAGRGLQFLLTGTGDAPGLPSLVASNTTLPVLGIPLSATMLGGECQVNSLVHMRDETPVGTVAPGDSFSAALVALRTLALHDEELRARLEELHSVAQL